jgi:hypothetical protein
MQNRRAIGVEILLNNQESEDAIVDEVSLFGFYFFVALGV